MKSRKTDKYGGGVDLVTFDKRCVSRFKRPKVEVTELGRFVGQSFTPHEDTACQILYYAFQNFQRLGQVARSKIGSVASWAKIWTHFKLWNTHTLFK